MEKVILKKSDTFFSTEIKFIFIHAQSEGYTETFISG